MEWLVSDQGMHFHNRLIKELSDRVGAKNHFTTPYCPWANGTIERVCREVLRACRAMLSEWGLPARDWPRVVESVQSVLNHAPRERLGRRNNSDSRVYFTPQEVFTGQAPVRPLLEAITPVQPQPASSLDEVRARQLINVAEIMDALGDMHRSLAERVNNARRRQIERHKRQKNVKSVRFRPGDLVLVRRATRSPHKLDLQWLGPRRVVDALSDHVYLVENILTAKRDRVHVRRMVLYRGDLDSSSIDPALVAASERNDAHIEVAERIRAIRCDGDDMLVQVEWDGLPSEQDFTWEPISQVFEDLPGLLEDFLNSASDRNLKRRALARFLSSS